MFYYQIEREDSNKLRKQLTDSQNQCVKLQQMLSELADFSEELLHQNEAGDVDVIDVSPERVNQFKDQLSSAESLVSEITESLQGKVSSNECWLFLRPHTLAAEGGVTTAIFYD